MADDTTPPSDRPDLRAGKTLDLSTGPGAPPPPPRPPRPPATPDPEVRVGKSLDLSKRPPGPPSKPRIENAFGAGPVIRETVDFSSPTPPPGAEPTDAPSRDSGPSRRRDKTSGRRDGGPPTHRNDGRRRDHSRRDDSPGRGGKKGEAPVAASSSLADLLDPEMLAKLRGGG